MLVSPEEAKIIAQEVRDDFRAAVEETKQLSQRLERIATSRRPSPPPQGETALKAVKDPTGR